MLVDPHMSTWQIFVAIGGVKMLVAIAITIVLFYMLFKMNREPDHAD